jgi:hypothetical protein
MSKEPKYEVLESYEKIELRLYEPFLVAEVECPGIRKEAIRSGFRILANYIFGNNQSHAIVIIIIIIIIIITIIITI